MSGVSLEQGIRDAVPFHANTTNSLHSFGAKLNPLNQASAPGLILTFHTTVLRIPFRAAQPQPYPDVQALNQGPVPGLILSFPATVLRIPFRAAQPYPDVRALNQASAPGLILSFPATVSRIPFRAAQPQPFHRRRE